MKLTYKKQNGVAKLGKICGMAYKTRNAELSKKNTHLLIVITAYDYKLRYEKVLVIRTSE